MRFALLSLLVLSTPLLAADEIKLSQISLEQIQKAIAAHKGKVVLVDIWATFCAPCKEKFPSVVKMHKEYAKDGLVVISLTIDELDDEKHALEFLKKHEATFANYILKDTDANKDAWEKRWANIAPPIVHLYDREGKKVKTLEGKTEVSGTEAIVKELLKAK